ncbi:MAG: FG-GAP repeat domain-containing protein [Bacteroidota bacterium]
MRLLSISILLFYFLSACQKGPESGENSGSLKPSGLKGDALAIQYCTSCHAYVPPEMLPKSIWEKDVLPAMGHRLGIFKGDHQPDSLFDKGIGGDFIRRANIYPEQPVIPMEDWQKIVNFYLEQAPDAVSPPVREEPITIGLRHFKYKESKFAHRPPITSLVKILPNNRGLVFGDGKKDANNLTFLDRELMPKFNFKLTTTPIHFYEKSDTVYLAIIGKSLFPHDAPDGSVLRIPGTVDVSFKNASSLISNLQRPVDLSYGDLNRDGLDDIVVCEYGNLTGKLVWYENKGEDHYQMRLLRSKPGAIESSLVDLDNDELLDIIVLMAQGDEGVFWYKNLGNGRFRETRLLTFLPLNGSQYFELHDFNEDGYLDILYVCGDNADQTPILKPYHGIYIYQNNGKNEFEQTYFYRLNGAYKAMARDYDEDGDLDIAAISFFPDYVRYPEESFVYLENLGMGKYKDYSFENATNGRWMVMDAGDLDGDGDIDIALGSCMVFVADGDTTGLSEKWITSGPSVAILENTVK